MTAVPHATPLEADGETATLVRSIDWSSTPLGPRSSWPASLRTTTDLCLASRFPIVLYWGSDLVTIYNDAYAPILRSKHPWALGRPCREVWAEIWDIIGPMLWGVMATGAATWSDDMLLVLERRGYSEECYFSFSFTPVRVEDGRVGGIFTAVIETTERVVGERRLSTLRELGQHVTDVGTVEEACGRAARTIARNPADIPFSLIYLLDAADKRLRLIASSGVVTGDQRDRMAECAARVLARGHAERVEFGCSSAEAAEPGAPDAPTSAMVLPILRPGLPVPYGVLIAGISPRRELDEHYRGFYDLLADGVTTVVANARAYEEERARVEALADIDRAKTTFFSNVSHEFRTPLTLMLGPLEELARTPLPDAARAELDVILRNGRRLLKLVNALLDFSRIEAGRVEAVYEPTDLAAVTAELTGVFRSAMERAGLRLVVDCDPLPEPVYVDREMWEKIVLNLLSNAFKFTLQGEIAVSLKAAGNEVELRVRDTGVGIPAHELPHVFERFHRVKGSLARTHEGTGIGLSLVRELVILHGGTIRAESTEGRETTLTVSIPRGAGHLPRAQIGASRTLAATAAGARAHVDEALRWLPEGVVVDPETAMGPGTADSGTTSPALRPYIVCADDNADMRAYLSRLLSPHYEVETVGDGHAALRAVQRRIPDLVITDVMMPGVDGLDLLQRLRADSRTSLVPVVVLSARAGEESRVDGLQSGADDYLVKPFSSRELLARVGAHLEIARMRKGILRKERAAVVAVEACESQRRRIARDLHDQLGQKLTALVLRLRSMRTLLPRSSAEFMEVLRVEAMARDIGLDVHRIGLELRPGALDDHGLQMALSNYIDEWSKRYGVAADFQHVGLGPDRLPPHVENTIYRIVQEALTNVVKHARATEVSVVLQRVADEVVAVVEDNGTGFDVTSSPNASGRAGRLGLVGMRERATLAGGTCDVESHAAGTTVFARIPAVLDEDAHV